MGEKNRLRRGSGLSLVLASQCCAAYAIVLLHAGLNGRLERRAEKVPNDKRPLITLDSDCIAFGASENPECTAVS